MLIGCIDQSFKMNVLAKTIENYIGISIYFPRNKTFLVFLHGYEFLSSSLPNLAKLLHEDDKQLIKDECEKNYFLLLKKLCFLYEYVIG